MIWASNTAAVPSAGNGTCGNVGYQSTLGGNYTTQYAYTNLGQLWQGPKNGGSTQEQYLYCDSAHPHQLSNLSQTASTPTCASQGTVDYTGTYDSWGNTTSQVRDGITRTLKYDGLDHLMRWNSSVNSQEEWNLYDSSGERVLRRTYDGTNTVLTVFAFGVEEHAYSYSGSGSTDTNTSNTYYYTLAGRTLGTWDGTSPGSPTTNFLLTDTLGSVVSSFNNLPNGAAVVLGDQVYGPYGNRRVQQGTIGTSKGFTGQFTDFVAGLDYYHARYYDPVVGVFVSADTVQGNAQGTNPYGYVGGNPETKTDPTGQRFISGDPGSEGTTAVIEPNGTIAVDTPGKGTTTYFQGVITSSSPKGSTHPRYDFGTVQGRRACYSNAACADAMHKEAADRLKEIALQAVGWGIFGIDLLSTLADNVYGPDEAELQYERNLEEAQLAEEEDQAALNEWTCSFTSQTLVTTDTGKKPIVTLEPGKRVLSYNPKTHKMEWKPIVHVWITHDNDLVDLTLTTERKNKHHLVTSHEVIHTNQKHPFLTEEHGFMPVRLLRIGMHIMQADGSKGVITEWKLVPGVKTMYNLEVAQDHTFTVGNGQWIVHNTGSGCDDAASSSGQSGPIGSFTKVNDGYLKKIGIDAHAFKKGILGPGAPISHFDIYKDGNGDLYLLSKNGLKSDAIPTYTNIDDPNS